MKFRIFLNIKIKNPHPRALPRVGRPHPALSMCMGRPIHPPQLHPFPRSTRCRPETLASPPPPPHPNSAAAEPILRRSPPRPTPSRSSAAAPPPDWTHGRRQAGRRDAGRRHAGRRHAGRPDPSPGRAAAMPGHAAPGHMHAGRQMRLQAGPPPRRCASTPAWIQRCVGPPPHVLHAGPLARLYAKLGRVASTRARRCHVLGNRVDGRQATAPGTTKKEASWRFSRLQKQCLDLLAAIPLAHTKGTAPFLSRFSTVLCLSLCSPLDSSLMLDIDR